MLAKLPINFHKCNFVSQRHIWPSRGTWKLGILKPSSVQFTIPSQMEGNSTFETSLHTRGTSWLKAIFNVLCCCIFLPQQATEHLLFRFQACHVLSMLHVGWTAAESLQKIIPNRSKRLYFTCKVKINSAMSTGPCRTHFPNSHIVGTTVEQQRRLHTPTCGPKYSQLPWGWTRWIRLGFHQVSIS